MSKILKRYAFLLGMIVLVAILYFIDSTKGIIAIDTALFTLKEMVLIIPPIFLLLGLLDVWVPHETMVKYMGKGSGIKGILLAIFLGTAAAGPLYAAFPIAAVLMRKGAKYSNIILFIGAWSTTKLPMFAFETSTLGLKFSLTRMIMSLIGISIIALIMNKAMSKVEIEEMYKRAEQV